MSKFKSLEELFTGRHFDREVIILWVRWYLRYKLSLRDLVKMMAERGLSLAHAPKEVPVGHHDLALGEALFVRICQTLESFWHAHRSVLACR
jgi:transposase-like protein